MDESGRQSIGWLSLQGASLGLSDPRALMTAIREGDQAETRRLFNTMLMPVFMAEGSLPLLQARCIEWVAQLVRAALEDNELQEALVRRLGEWIDEVSAADSLEALSAVITSVLDRFVDSIFLHGINRRNRHVQKAVEYVMAHYTESISLKDVASEIGISGTRLAHLMREHMGRSLVELLHDARIRKAQHLLERADLTCAEIAYEVGYGDQSYFTVQFRRRVGDSPTGYRRHFG
jgi:YesN/AraC family two-component response regulator